MKSEIASLKNEMKGDDHRDFQSRIENYNTDDANKVEGFFRQAISMCQAFSEVTVGDALFDFDSGIFPY